MPTKYDKWTREESEKMLDYLCRPENLRIFLYNKNYCYNQISEHILRDRSAGQIKNKLASLENRYKKAQRQLQKWLEDYSLDADSLTSEQQKEMQECFDPPVPEYTQLDTVFKAKPTRLRVSLLSFESTSQQPTIDVASVAMQSKKRRIDDPDGPEFLQSPAFNVRRHTESELRGLPRPRTESGPSTSATTTTASGDANHSGLLAGHSQLPLMPPSVSTETTITTNNSMASSRIPSHQGSNISGFSPMPSNHLSPFSGWTMGQSSRDSSYQDSNGFLGLSPDPPIDQRRNSIAAIVHAPGSYSPGQLLHLSSTGPSLPSHRNSDASSSTARIEYVRTLPNRPLNPEEITLHNRELTIREREQEHQHRLDVIRQQQEYHISLAQIELQQRELAVREKEAELASRSIGFSREVSGAPRRASFVASLESYRIGSPMLPEPMAYRGTRHMSFQADTNTPLINVTAPQPHVAIPPSPTKHNSHVATVANSSGASDRSGTDLLNLPSDDLLKYRTTAAPEEQHLQHSGSSHQEPMASNSMLSQHNYVLSPSALASVSGGGVAAHSEIPLINAPAAHACDSNDTVHSKSSSATATATAPADRFSYASKLTESQYTPPVRLSHH
ncbi:hypothetical protein FBU59_001214 [Linderina macrospora]|uniref:Uncharacterized protein n=1 Tax=Linderina macrospora TaxID=4868 RepID=A0ACC1JEX1_9FUNG|nr:hypothetical protein FBU59_001214 [Linderina macrospora]